ncbi:MAG: 16S rRNA (uracil(1498)-N(3))-methyltransferase [Candidatus Gracilibacteria bacterium]|nr:16S rRNA (uracil(1498)-N(3))-methyltransferase [Candidatus Gracilibacteria bacterium]
MQRIYLENLKSDEEQIILTQADILHQLIKVLRVRLGEKICFFNGQDSTDYLFEITELEKRKIICNKLQEESNNSESNISLHLYNSFPNKLEKIEYILQKGTEVGFTEFHFFHSERSQKLNLSENKIIRLEKIIIEAVEQSGRSIVPQLFFHDHLDFSDFKNQNNVFFHTQNNKSKGLRDLNLTTENNINLFVGPEGGFSEEEVIGFEDHNFYRIHLGNRILRTETTGMVTGFFILQNI